MMIFTAIFLTVGVYCLKYSSLLIYPDYSDNNQTIALKIWANNPKQMKKLSKTTPLLQGIDQYISMRGLCYLWKTVHTSIASFCASIVSSTCPILLQLAEQMDFFFLYLLIACIQEIIKMFSMFCLRKNVLMLVIPISFTYIVVNAGGF